VGVRGKCGEGGELSGPRLLRGSALTNQLITRHHGTNQVITRHHRTKLLLGITVMSLISLSGSLPLTVKASAAPAAPPEDRRDDFAETLLLGVSRVHDMEGRRVRSVETEGRRAVLC
jgi:hypothetical protein